VTSQGYTLMTPPTQSCPECGGAMMKERAGALLQFRCHIGHLMTAESLVVSQLDTMEKSLEWALRALNERAEICRQMATEDHVVADPALREAWLAAEREARDRSERLRQMLLAEWITPESNPPPIVTV
jgi:two-component system chemotaxis response regulator CheB